MCGIIGYIGNKQASPFLIDGLSKLEYRGYDSAGIAVINQEKIKIKKTLGRLKKLSEITQNGELVKGHVGIGHTRWATHGAPSDQNSHPHFSPSGNFAIVHNGIIENYLTLKKRLSEKGYPFVSETDSEVIACLLDECDNGDFLKTVSDAVKHLEGSYALGIISCKYPDQIVAVRKDSPLIIGLGENENFIASDIPAVLQHTKKIYILEDNEIACLTCDGVSLYNYKLEAIQRDIFHVNWDISSAEKGGYDHFMIKEIMEEPQAIMNTLSPFLNNGLLKLKRNPSAISIVGCGSAYHAGVVGKYVIENMTGIPVEVDIASEFRYRNPIISKDTLIILITQSGETADTLAAMREAKKKGAQILAVVNVLGSSVAREADEVLYTFAGPEIAVATTKAYTTQLLSMYLIALSLKKSLGKLSESEEKIFIEQLLSLSTVVSRILEEKDMIESVSSLYHATESVFFIGRGLDYALSLEGSLKLKEISYIHSEAYGAGELKHGTISLIEDGTLVFAVLTQDALFEKTLSNIKEVKARGAKILALTFKNHPEIEECADSVIYMPETPSLFSPVPAVTVLQLFAYYVAKFKGCDIDKPRNLAKSVTVE